VYRQKILFTYRLADMLSYYLVFVAVYSIQSTLQLTIPFNSLSYQWGYFVCIAVCGYMITSYLTDQNRSYIDRLSQSLTCEQHDKLRIKQGIQRKLSSYITSSISYLLAYACWNSIQATLMIIAAKHTRSHVWFVWVLSSVVMITGTALLVLLNIRIHSQVLPNEDAPGMQLESLAAGAVLGQDVEGALGRPEIAHSVSRSTRGSIRSSVAGAPCDARSPVVFTARSCSKRLIRKSIWVAKAEPGSPA